MTISTELNKATPTNFQLAFPVIPGQTGITANVELTLNIHSVVLPAISINPIDVNWQGALHKVAGSPLDFEIMNVQFNVDASFKNWLILFNWMTYISNGRDKMMENHKQYVVDSSLKVINNFNQNVLAVKFIDMWPTNLQEVSFSYKEGEVLLESGGTFVYDYFQVSDIL